MGGVSHTLRGTSEYPRSVRTERSHCHLKDCSEVGSRGVNGCLPSPGIPHVLGSGSGQISEFEASLVYRVNSRPTMAVQTLSQKQNRKRCSWGWREGSAVEYLLLRPGVRSQHCVVAHNHL